MSPNTTPSAPAARASAAPPWWARGLPSRGCDWGCGSSAPSACAPRRVATWLMDLRLTRRPAPDAQAGPAAAGAPPGRPGRSGRGGRPAGALLAGLEQALAQLGLLVRARVPLRGLGEVLE